MELTLKIVDAQGDLLATVSGHSEITLVYRRPYREGDCILIESLENGHVTVALDEVVAPAMAYLRGPLHRFAVPFGERRRSYSPKAFGGDLHRLHLRAVHADQITARRNLALNPWDDHVNTTLFPHASANVETRGEAVF